MIKYSTISLPKELYDKLLQLIEEKPELGYGSVADFCKEAIRLHVEEIKRELREDFLRKLDVPLLLKNLERLSAIDTGIYGKMFEKINAMAFMFSKDYKLKECNYEFFSHLGYASKEEVIGKDINEFFENEQLKERVKTGNLKDYEVKGIRKDGKKIDLLLDIVRIDNKLYAGFGKDITVKNYIIEKEKRTRQLYEHIIDEICESIIVVQDGKIKFLNKSIGSTGYELEEIIGKNFLEFVADEDKERIMENYKKIMEGKLEPKPRRYKFKLKDGRIREAELYSKKIEFEGRPAILAVLRI